VKVKASKRCGCRDEETGKQLGKNCPKLHGKNHGAWSYRIRIPAELRHLIGGREFATGGGYPTAKKAQEAGEKVVARLRSEHEVTDVTVGEYLTKWLADKRRLRPSTARSYSDHIRMYFVPKLGHLQLDKLRPSHILGAYDDILIETAGHPRPVTPASIVRFNATLRSALGTAVKQRKLTWNPAAHVELPEVERHEVEPWSAEELGRFLDAAADDRLSCLYEVMAFTGLRRGQVVGLRWRDVDLDNAVLIARDNHVDVAGTVHVGPAKARSSEGLRLDLDAGTVGALLFHEIAQAEEREALEIEVADDFVFCWEDGRPLRPEYVSRRMLAIAKRAGFFGEVRDEAKAGATELQLRTGTRGTAANTWTLYRDREPLCEVKVEDCSRGRSVAVARLAAPLPIDVEPGDELGRDLLSRKRLHDLRHGAASLEIDAGFDITIVSKRRGHGSTRTTSDLYVHMLKGGVGKRAADAAAALVPRAGRAPSPPPSVIPK
jgi:integrase